MLLVSSPPPRNYHVVRTFKCPQEPEATLCWGFPGKQRFNTLQNSFNQLVKQKVADPIVSEHFAKAGLGVVLIDQQHGLSISITPFCNLCQVCWTSLWISIIQLQFIFATFLRSVGRADLIWVFATVGEVPCLLSDGSGSGQHSSSHKVCNIRNTQNKGICCHQL